MQDLVMAYVWYNVAATNGNNIAKARRDKVLKRLADLERRLAVKLSRQCHEKPASCPKYSS
jgi:TPR repeat protein